MARLFDDGSSEYLEIDQAVVSTYPFSVSLWFYTDSNTDVQYTWHMSDKDVADQQFGILLNYTVSASVRGIAFSGANFYEAVSSASLSVNTWHCATYVATSATDRSIFLDGGNEGTNTTSLTPSGMDRTSIGRAGDSTPAYYMSGRVCEVGMWNAALSDAEVAILGHGYSSLFVHPANLVAHWSLIRDEDQDRVGGYDMTAYNTPSVAAHCPKIIYPASNIVATTAVVGQPLMLRATQVPHSRQWQPGAFR